MSFHPRIIQPTEKTAASVGGDSKYELPDKGFLTAVLAKIDFTMVSGAQLATEKWRVEDYIDQVKLTCDGSYDVVSVTGRVLNAVQAFNTGRGALGWHRDYATGTNRGVLMIPVGHHFFDPKLSLDLSKYNSVELEISNDGSSTYQSAISERLHAVVYDQLPPNTQRLGFLRLREWRKWTTVQAAWEYMKLPSEHPITRIILQAVAAMSSNVPYTDFHNLMRAIELKIRSGQIELFDGQMFDLTHINALDYGGENLAGGMKDTTADKGIRTGLGRQIGFGAISMSEDGAVSSNVPTIDDRQAEMIKPEDREADSPIAWLIRGFAPESCGVFRFDRDPMLADVLDPTVDGTVNLNIQTRDAASAVGGTNRVIVEQLVRGDK